MSHLKNRALLSQKNKVAKGGEEKACAQAPNVGVYPANGGQKQDAKKHRRRTDEVEQKGDYLVFKGEFFFDDDGMPTPKTNAVFNMFKKLSVTLSHKYKL